MMKIDNDLQNVSMPNIYIREGKRCYYDTFRRKLIEITPEETVRQRIASYVVEKLNVPKKLVMLEVPMSCYIKDAKGRADIVIHAIDDNGNFYPVTIIECKNENIPLTDKVIEQAMGYCDLIGGMYIIITNGIEIEMMSYNESKDSYIVIDGLVNYKDMLTEKYSYKDEMGEVFSRFSIEELKKQELLNRYNNEGMWIYGEDTPNALRAFAVNLYQCLLDCNHKLPYVKNKCFELIEDIGLRYVDYSNAGGGHYLGEYRAFLVKDRKGETQIVSFSVFGTDGDFRGENRKSITCIVVAIDAFKTSHNSLQYNLDRFAKIEKEHIRLLHNGQMGNNKAKNVIEYVEQNGENLMIKEEMIDLGTLPMNELMYLDRTEVATTIYNMIEYALLREEVRKKIKK